MIKANRRRGLDHGPSSSTAINQTSAQHGMHERPWHEAGGYCGAASRRVLKVLRTAGVLSTAALHIPRKLTDTSGA